MSPELTNLLVSIFTKAGIVAGFMAGSSKLINIMLKAFTRGEIVV